MPKITVLPHEELCPQGVTFEAQKGETVAKALLANGVKIPHACDCLLYTSEADDEL